jgi:hypothetical protein
MNNLPFNLWKECEHANPELMVFLYDKAAKKIVTGYQFATEEKRDETYRKFKDLDNRPKHLVIVKGNMRMEHKAK